MPLRNTYKQGDHLVTTEDGDVRYASECAYEKNGPRKGLLVAKEDLDEPGVSDIRPNPRKVRERRVRPVTSEPRITWRTYDQDGDVVEGGPAD